MNDIGWYPPPGAGAKGTRSNQALGVLRAATETAHAEIIRRLHA